MKDGDVSKALTWFQQITGDSSSDKTKTNINSNNQRIELDAEWQRLLLALHEVQVCFVNNI